MRRFNTFASILTTLFLVGCNSVRPIEDLSISSPPRVTGNILKNFNQLPAPAGPPITIAVYGFKDLTGQRKNSNSLSLFSTAVTQGAESYLIRSLQEAGQRRWFTVVERVGLDNLNKERQMIRQTREIYEGANAKPLPPLTLAGVMIEGGIIDYNTNTRTGGLGARLMGIGPATQYTQDIVVVSLRLISVQTGEVLNTVTVEKNLLSTADSITAFKFFNQATRSFELDTAQTFNEPTSYALRSAIEQAVVELILGGERLSLWKFAQ